MQFSQAGRLKTQHPVPMRGGLTHNGVIPAPNEPSFLDFRNLLVWPAYVLLFLMLVFPMVVQLLYAKALLFVLLIILVGISVWTTDRSPLHPTVALWTLFLITVGALSALRGMFLGAPGALKAAQVYVLWPLVYAVLISGVTQKRILIGLQRTIVVATLCIAVQGGVYFLTQADVLPENTYIALF